MENEFENPFTPEEIVDIEARNEIMAADMRALGGIFYGTNAADMGDIRRNRFGNYIDHRGNHVDYLNDEVAAEWQRQEDQAEQDIAEMKKRKNPS